ncbi:DUF6090 family protein [Balneola sp. MJW-20]|uniref:DUF6090 family protein n=1 Tax=Gracilimonas aurantiaca TaxID=3234185 RepID=UPI003465B542
MITLFRRIRQKLIESGSVTKYLLYAIGEILLVVVGILIALQVNNWNEERRQREVSFNTLQSLKTELEEAKSGLDDVIGFNNDLLKDSELYIYEKFSKDSLKADPGAIFRFTNYTTIKLDLPVLERELSSDRLIQGEDSLNTKLREIKTLATRMSESFVYLDEFWNSQVTPYFIEKRIMVYLHQNLRTNEELAMSNIEQAFEDEEYRNLAAMCNLFTYSFTRQAETLLTTIDETLILIEGMS